MTAPSSAPADAEPGCRLVAREVPFGDIPRATWDRLLGRTATATPFSRWTVHRAWWDGYAETAEPAYLIVAAPEAPDVVRGVVPLMRRERRIFFGASYHADYATVLCDRADLEGVCTAAAQHLAAEPRLGAGSEPWTAVDLRRLRHDDPALPALEAAFRAVVPDHGWTVEREQEDVCPVISLPADGDWETYLGTLDKKARHEIRRKIRRAEGAGPNAFALVEPTPEAIEAFIELHQARWEDEGLFPDTPDGQRSGRFVHRLAELELSEGEGRQLQLGRFSIGPRVILAGLSFEDGTTCYFYNAGMDPAARELSPGVTGTAAYIRDRLESGACRRFDFLRGDEAYKYEWGAVDEPIYRLLVRRIGTA
ncbi:MAG TPA: GNAT family N-acetyltransferase [Candidatus Limnocylindrales bacterium]|nr:GNAT family N-acetyltransferase [Candidatus Limnocylindrales bacterium]